MLHRQRLNSRRRGFSLIELMIVVVIVGLLASIALPAYEDAQRDAYNTVVLADLNAAKQAIEAYITNQGKLPDEDDLMDSGFTLSPGVTFEKYDVKDEGTSDERIHIHIAHEASPQYYHIEYPRDSEAELEWKRNR